MSVFVSKNMRFSVPKIVKTFWRKLRGFSPPPNLDSFDASRVSDTRGMRGPGRSLPKPGSSVKSKATPPRKFSCPPNLDFFAFNASGVSDTRRVGGPELSLPEPDSLATWLSTLPLDKMLTHVVLMDEPKATDMMKEQVGAATDVEQLKAIMNYAVGGAVRVNVTGEDARALENEWLDTPARPEVVRAVVDKLLKNRDTREAGYPLCNDTVEIFKGILERGIQENDHKWATEEEKATAAELRKISATLAPRQDAAAGEPAGRILSRL